MGTWFDSRGELSARDEDGGRTRILYGRGRLRWNVLEQAGYADVLGGDQHIGRASGLQETTRVPPREIRVDWSHARLPSIQGSLRPKLLDLRG